VPPQPERKAVGRTNIRFAVDADFAQSIDISIDNELLELRQVVGRCLATPNGTHDERRKVHAERPATDVLPIDRGSAAIREREEVRAHEIVVEGRLLMHREARDALMSRRNQRLGSLEPIVIDVFHDRGSAGGVSQAVELRQRLLDTFRLAVPLCPGVF